MRKPKFLAMTLALALVAGTALEVPVTVRAEETMAAAPSESQGDRRPSESQGDRRPSESQGDRPSESQGDRPSETPGDAPGTVDFELAAPENVGWKIAPYNRDDRWYLSFTIPNRDALAERNGKCIVTLYKDGQKLGRMERHYFTDGGVYSSSIMESGNYKFSVYVEAEINGVVQKSSEIFSSEQEYTVPEQRLGGVQDIVWDAEKTGKFYFTPLEGEVDYYWVRGYKEVDGGKSHGYGCGVGTGYGSVEKTEDGRIAVDISNYIKESGEGIYYASVQAFSKNIDAMANGYESELSAPLDTRAKSASVSDKITDAVTSKNPTEAVKTIQETIGVSELATNMQIDDTVLKQIQKLETDYKESNDITVEVPNVSAEAATLGVDSSRVSMVGAAFNANPNSAVSLAISVPETKVEVPEGYKNGVQLDIKLNGASSADGTLEMPITITMPVPAGVELGKLILWHYHGDSRDEVKYKDNADGTITFTVTSFSTFLFTEEQTGDQPGGDQPGGDQPSGDQPGSNSTTNNSNGSSSSSTSVTETVTEEKKAPVAIEYVVKRGDSMAKIARRHGITLRQLIALNPQVKNPARIYAGQVLIVGYTNAESVAAGAANAEYYTVCRGDSLFKIAAKNSLTLLELKILNPMLFAQRYIFAGQKVRVK